MMTDFRALCAELTDKLHGYASANPHHDSDALVARARAALADEPAVPDVVGPEWQPCVKLPITVHVREQRPGEQHVSTREGITPVRPDDLVMRGVAGEEYPIGRELFHRTYRMGSADEPAVPEGREPASVTGQPNWRGLCEELVDAWLKGDDIVSAMNRARDVLARWGHQPAPPADGEVVELPPRPPLMGPPAHPALERYGITWDGSPDKPLLTRRADGYWTPWHVAADLLERQQTAPVAVSDALIKAECALSDIAEGEPMTDEGDPLKWAERRCADTLAIIRPTMMQHKIRTSEWPPVAATAKPLPEVDE